MAGGRGDCKAKHPRIKSSKRLHPCRRNDTHARSPPHTHPSMLPLARCRRPGSLGEPQGFENDGFLVCLDSMWVEEDRKYYPAVLCCAHACHVELKVGNIRGTSYTLHHHVFQLRTTWKLQSMIKAIKVAAGYKGGVFDGTSNDGQLVDEGEGRGPLGSTCISAGAVVYS